MIYLVSNQYNLYDSSLFKNISLDEGISLLKGIPELGLDTETEGLDSFTKKLLLLQIGTYDFQVLFDIASFEGRIPDKLAVFLNESEAVFIMQNAKFDLQFLFQQNIVIKNVYDTMLVETILTNGLQYGGRDLATITMKYCNVGLDKSVRGDIITKGLSDRVLLYGAHDVKYLPKVKEAQLIEVEKNSLQVAVNLDNSFVVVLAYIEFCGIKLDYEKWRVKTKNNIEEVAKLQEILEDQLRADDKMKYFSRMVNLWTGKRDCAINWDSPLQVKELFKDYGVNVIIRKKGEEIESIDAKVLEPQVDKFTILRPYLEYKAKQKEVSTYGYKWKTYINPVTGRIHTSYKQLMDTSRLSSGDKRENKPNMQNLPAGLETRSCFIPEKGNVMIDADYSGQETIVLVNHSREPGLIKFYEKGLDDMHSYIAFLMYKNIRSCDIEDISKETLKHIKTKYPDKRQIAKAAGFAIAYGGNGSTIAKNCNIPKRDGEFVYNSYFESFPVMKKYFDLVFNRAAHFGHIEFNRVTKRKYFFDLEKNDYFRLRDEVTDPYFRIMSSNPGESLRRYNSAKSEIQRIAQNYPIQGTSSDITKYAGVLFFKEILYRHWWKIVKIVNVIHDEFLIECPKEIAEEVKKVLIDCMEQAGKPFCPIVPLKADASIGEYWVH
jgi:DNA polymerase I